MRPRHVGWMAVLVLIFAAAPAYATFHFTFECGSDRSDVVAAGVSHTFRAPIRDVSPGNHYVYVRFTPHLPSGWSAQYCQVSTGTCYYDDEMLKLTAGVNDTLTIDVYPTSTPGIGGVEIAIISEDDPYEISHCDYALYAGVQPQNVDYSVNCSNNTDWLTQGTSVTFDMPIKNLTAIGDSLLVTLHPDIPDTWFTQFCQVSTGTCYPDSGVIPLPANFADDLQVDFYMFSAPPASGSLDVDIHSRKNPVLANYCHYVVYLGDYPGAVPNDNRVGAFKASWAEPNPFTNDTRLQLVLPEASRASLSIYGADGRVVRSMPEVALPAGTATFRWNGRSDAGALVPSGIYFYRFQTGLGEIRGTIVRAR